VVDGHSRRFTDGEKDVNPDSSDLVMDLVADFSISTEERFTPADFRTLLRGCFGLKSRGITLK
jgi:hypothetical protein